MIITKIIILIPRFAYHPEVPKRETRNANYRGSWGPLPQRLDEG